MSLCGNEATPKVRPHNCNFFMAVNEESNNIPNDVYRAHYHAIKRELHACIEAYGGNTKY